MSCPSLTHIQVELHDAAEAGSAADGSEAAGNEGEGEGATLVAVSGSSSRAL